MPKPAARAKIGSGRIRIIQRWFLGCLDRAIGGSENTLSGVLRKAHFREAIKGQALNERQRMVINRVIDGFEGKLTSSKWAKLTKNSPDTALRDINDRVKRGIFENPGGASSTDYSLAKVD